MQPKLCNIFYTGYTRKNGAVSKVNKKLISHLTRAHRAPSAAATVQVYRVRVPLNRFLQQRWIGRAAKRENHLLAWPPRSPDLTPCDFFVWAFVKDCVYLPPLPISLKEHRDRITDALQNITTDLLHRVSDVRISHALIQSFNGATWVTRHTYTHTHTAHTNTTQKHTPHNTHTHTTH